MKLYIFLSLGAVLFYVSSAIAGPIYGTVRIDSVPAEGVYIEVACPSFSSGDVVSVSTDYQGSYSLHVSAAGRCEMHVIHQGRTGDSFEMFVSDKPLRFDIAVDKYLNLDR